MDQPAQIITETVPTPAPVSVNIQPPPSPKPKKGFLIFFLSILGLILAGGLVYAGMQIEKKQNQVPFSPTPVPTEVLIPTITLIPTEVATPTSIPSAPAIDPKAGWKIFSGKGVEFKYPSDWKDDGYFITSASPKIKIYVVSKDSTLMNECMREASVEDKGAFTLRRFTRVTEGEMCFTLDSTPREIWVVPSATAYSPGMSYQYLSSEGQLAESVFDQILSTFKFLD